MWKDAVFSYRYRDWRWSNRNNGKFCWFRKDGVRMLSLILGATALATSTSLVLEGCITTISLYGICKGVSGISTKASYSFKH